MATPKTAATEENAGKLHNQIFDILLEQTLPIGEVDLDNGEVRKVYDKDYVKMAMAALKDNKIQVIETVDNSAGQLRKQLQEQRTPQFKVVPDSTVVTEDDLKEDAV